MPNPAGAFIRGMEGHLRYLAPLDADRRQDPPRQGADDEPLVAGAAVCDLPRPHHLADPERWRGGVSNRSRFQRPSLVYPRALTSGDSAAVCRFMKACRLALWLAAAVLAAPLRAGGEEPRLNV